MRRDEYDLPDLICLSDYNGDWETYINAVYEIFERDCIKDKIFFRGRKINLKRHPLFQNRECTFYHITHEGKDEHDRTPDLRRCERIEWIRIVLKNCDKWGLKIWEQDRNGKTRIVIWLELEDDDDYIIILDDRGTYLLLWTVFNLKYDHQKRKKLREYREYIKKQKPPR